MALERLYYVFLVGLGVGLGLPKIENFLKNSNFGGFLGNFVMEWMVNIVEREKWGRVSTWV